MFCLSYDVSWYIVDQAGVFFCCWYCGLFVVERSERKKGSYGTTCFCANVVGMVELVNCFHGLVFAFDILTCDGFGLQSLESVYLQYCLNKTR